MIDQKTAREILKNKLGKNVVIVDEFESSHLGYIKGDKYSVAVDAGHSANHVEQFYELLDAENLQTAYPLWMLIQL